MQISVKMCYVISTNPKFLDYVYKSESNIVNFPIDFLIKKNLNLYSTTTLLRSSLNKRQFKMSKSFFTDDRVETYVFQHSIRFSPEQRAMYERVMSKSSSYINGSPEVAQHMQLLCRAIGAKRVIELGCYAGLTTLALAQVIPDDGEIITCDISDRNVAKDIWRDAKVDHKIKLVVAPAINTLNKLLENNQADTFDFVFIDADKESYLDYYEACLKLIRRGGIIAIDNTFLYGKVLDKSNRDLDTQVLQKLNKQLRDDPRIELSMLAISDGLTLCLKK